MLFDELFDKIDQTPSFAKSRAKDIFEKLVSESKLVSMIMKYFQGKHAIANLILTVKPIPDQVPGKILYGVTYAPSEVVKDGKPGPYNIEVRINADYIGRFTNEGLAAVLLHELLHANLLAKSLSVASVKGVVDLPALRRNRDYPALYEVNCRYNHKPYDRDHELYGLYYKRDFISIMETVTDRVLGKEAYEILFWGGLYETEAWRRLPGDKREKYRRQYNSFLLQ